MSIQVMPEADLSKLNFNPFDVTTVWSHADYHPNSFDQVGVLDDGTPPAYALGGSVWRHDHRSDNDYYSQAVDLK